jgi:c-di-GMP-binding flagellar brake protein YcgR
MGEELRKGTRLFKVGEYKAKVVKCPQNRKLRGARIAGKTVDVSAEGMQIRYQEEIPVGSIMKLQVESAFAGLDPRTFKLQAEVVRVESGEGEYLMGLKFGKRPRKEVEAWQEYVYATLRLRNN